MKITINELKYVNSVSCFKDYLYRINSNETIINKLLSSMYKVDMLTTEMVFDVEDYIISRDVDVTYFIVKNEIGYFILREDNVTEVIDNEATLANSGISRLIRNGNKTILITDDGSKYITTRQPEDKDDVEKAVMLVLLKSCGYTAKEIYSIIDTVR